MISERPYRRAVEPARRSPSCAAAPASQFDPDVVEAFEDVLAAREEQAAGAAGQF